jgi:hypothetical protein
MTPKINKRLPIEKNPNPRRTNVLEPPLPKKDAPCLTLLTPLAKRKMLVMRKREPTIKATLDISKKEVSIWGMIGPQG